MDKWNRYLVTANFAVSTLEEIRNLISEVETLNVSTAEATTSYTMTPPTDVRTRKKLFSGSAEVIYNFNTAICEFLAVARTTATRSIYTNATKPISPGGRTDLQRVFKKAEFYLGKIKIHRETIQKTIHKIDGNHSTHRKLVISAEDRNIIDVVRTKNFNVDEVQERMSIAADELDLINYVRASDMNASGAKSILESLNS